ncbi:hypothetical protein [Rhizobium sp. TH2]|uniref:hypothetical protein n=1 Tax=Rhizobium sp. TH2 TaxID=2775403 RepID=UPI0035BE3154
MTLADMEDALKSIRILCQDVRPIDVETHEGALVLPRRYNFSFYDALMVSSALRAGCQHLLSEDMHHSLHVESRLTILNPFLK